MPPEPAASSLFYLIVELICSGLTCLGNHIDAATFTVEFNMTIDQRIKRVVFSLSNTGTWVKFVSNLTNQDVSSDNFFAAKFLDTTTLRV